MAKKPTLVCPTPSLLLHAFDHVVLAVLFLLDKSEVPTAAFCQAIFSLSCKTFC